MYRITANTASTHLRRRKRHRAEPLDNVVEPAEARPELQPAPAVESVDSLQRIGAALDELPPKLRVLVVLKDVYGLPHEAIAEELGISVPAAKVRLHRARRKLRDLLYEEGAEAHAV
jgi:RNA polymerase sigma-70 factor (ECF subfamily)